MERNRHPRWARRAALATFMGITAASATASAASPGAEIWARTVSFFTLEYGFLAYTIAGSALVGALCGLLGVFMVLRRLSLMGDALGHAALPGIGIAFLLVQTKALGPIVLGATTTALLAALAIGAITRIGRTRPDAALGLVLAGFFGLGVVILSYLQNSASGAQSGLQDFMFGNAAAIQPAEVGLLGGLLALTVALVVALYRPLQLMTFDAVLAKTMGVPVRALHYGMMALVAVAIVSSMQSVGVVLVAAMLIIPASAARLLSDRFERVLLIAPALGAAAGVLGAWLSFLFDGFSSGPSMVLVAALFYTLALLFAPRRGLIAQRRQRQERLRRRDAEATPNAGESARRPHSAALGEAA
ncbi:MAG: ABC transporter [Myxococcales bacterium]|nr:ABC transporter [Myxococcales bacterium]